MLCVRNVLVHPDWGAVAHGVLVPKINSDSIYIAVSMLGATVMAARHLFALCAGAAQGQRGRGQ